MIGASAAGTAGADALLHHWHHTRRDHVDRNYAAMFPWIDRLFGTLHLPGEPPRAYGVEEAVPAGLAAQLAAPSGLADGPAAVARPAE